MATPMIVPDRMPARVHAPHHESGFAFRVPFCERGRTARRMQRLAREHDGAFQLERVGFLGTVRCTYRQRDSEKVLGFLAKHMRDRRVHLIDDYQRRYGVEED